MTQALAEAGLGPEAVGYVNAHGTATRVGDEVEAAAIAQVLGRRVPVSSTKALHGSVQKSRKCEKGEPAKSSGRGARKSLTRYFPTPEGFRESFRRQKPGEAVHGAGLVRGQNGRQQA